MVLARPSMGPMRRPAFRRLWLAGLISDTGDWLLLVSLPIVVYRDTGSSAGTAAAFLLQLAPPVLLAAPAGRLADRHDRPRTLLIVAVAQAAVLLPLLSAHGRGGLAIVYVVLVAQAALAALFDPAKNALLPALVGRGELVSANALVGLNANAGRLVGGSLGGALLAAGGGLTTIVAVDAASFLLAAALIAGVRAPAAPSTPAAPTTRTARLPSQARGPLCVVLLAGVAQGLFVVLFIVFVARVLHGGAREIGLLRGMQAIGAIAAGAGLALLARRLTTGALTAASAAVFGLISLAVWNAPHIGAVEGVYVGLFIAVGAPGTTLETGLTSAVQERTPADRLGRAFAAFGVAAAVGEAIGMVAGGVLGDRIGVVPVLDAQGCLYLLAGLLAAVLLRPPGSPATRSLPRPTAS